MHLRKKFSWALAVLLTGAALSPPAQADIVSADPADHGFDPQKLQGVRDAMAAEVARGFVPGASLLIERDGEIVFFEGTGQQGENDADRIDDRTIFSIFSMTKPVTSVAAMMLIEAGQMSLDDPISKHLPNYSEMVYLPAGEQQFVAAENQITVRDLLRHTSGLVYGRRANDDLADIYRREGVDSRAEDLAAWSGKLARLPLRFDPGTGWHYGYSTDVLGRLVEVVSGQSLDTFFQQRIFAPLGMSDTGFHQPKDNADRIAQPKGTAFPVLQKPVFLSGGGGLSSTTYDYLRFARMLHGGGELDGVRLLRAETVADMTRDHMGDIDRRWFLPGRSYGFGLGFAVRTNEFALYPGNPGDYWWAGFAGTYFWIDPAKDMIVVWMVQDPGNVPRYIGLTRTWVYGAMTDP